jgi:signal transduction histidine kinase
VLGAGEHEAVLWRVQLRIAPALEALLAAALERDALQAEVVETAALRRSDVIKTALLRAVSHDLRSPLTAILTAAEALRSPSITEAERRELAGAVTEEATRLSRLIDNLLDLSRLEADAAEPRPEWSSLEEVIGAAIEDLGLPEGTFKLTVDLGQIDDDHRDREQREHRREDRPALTAAADHAPVGEGERCRNAQDRQHLDEVREAAGVLERHRRVDVEEPAAVGAELLDDLL